MWSLSRGVTLLIWLMLTSCASTTSTSEYLTFNQQIGKSLAVSKSNSSKVISNYKKIPKFTKTRNLVAPGFLFFLNHPSDSKLKGRYRVDYTGILRLPYNVRINVAGQTFPQLKENVLKAYGKFFQRGVENVDFKLLYRQYYVEVRGFVKKPGRYLVTRRDSIDKVIDQAGGLKSDLEKKFYKATIKQQKTTYAISLNQYFQNNFYSNAFRWTGGDSIFISEQDESDMGSQMPIVTVLGGVLKPGKILYKDNAHLFYYLGKTGGTVSSLSYKESYIMRNSDKGVLKIKFDITEMDAIPAIMANDIILLQASKRTSTDKVFERTSQISSILLTVLLIMAL